MPEEKEPSPMHQNMDQNSASPSTTSVSQSRVEIEGYSVAYFDRTAVFEAPYCWTSVKGGDHNSHRNLMCGHFGVTMWEIFTLAKEHDVSDKQMIEGALKGKARKVLVKPDMCPCTKCIKSCWNAGHDFEQRATFEELFQLLTSIHNDL